MNYIIQLDDFGLLECPHSCICYFSLCVNSIGTIESKSLSNWDTHPSKDVIILPKIRLF